MAKQLDYLQTSELRDKGSFVGRKVEELIQIKVNHKTQVADVYLELYDILREDKESYEAVTIFQRGMPNTLNKKKWLDTLDIIPEEGIQFYAIFDLKTIKQTEQ